MSKRVCKFCGEPWDGSGGSYKAYPYCSRCRDQRIAVAQKHFGIEKGNVKFDMDGDYLVFLPSVDDDGVPMKGDD